ncbi:hypothetical protein HJG60_012006 [Phyllostomus discolor]|uniref:Uncharacterized protein n=1 Tax=Phyllostomus discolor TaxID=89673 RepID=A0A833ZPW0_9CHIR|nr:hypothetical protein HJG60_012006 [Phyllostomus discolor]
MSASPAPLTECPTPLACTLSPGPTTSSVSVLSLLPLSASQPPGPFLPLGGLSQRPVALPHSLSSSSDTEANPPAVTTSPEAPPAESASPNPLPQALAPLAIPFWPCLWRLPKRCASQPHHSMSPSKTTCPTAHLRSHSWDTPQTDR